MGGRKVYVLASRELRGRKKRKEKKKKKKKAGCVPGWGRKKREER
jgi:hypothetical protein